MVKLGGIISYDFVCEERWILGYQKVVTNVIFKQAAVESIKKTISETLKHVQCDIKERNQFETYKEILLGCDLLDSNNLFRFFGEEPKLMTLILIISQSRKTIIDLYIEKNDVRVILKFFSDNISFTCYNDNNRNHYVFYASPFMPSINQRYSRLIDKEK